MPYIPFTDEQKRTANSIDLAVFLRCQGEQLIRSGPEMRMKSNHSITINGNKWYDHAIRKGGGPVDFVQYFYNMDYQGAMQMLLGGYGISVPFPTAMPKPPKPEKEFTIPKANKNMRRVFAYLSKSRGIDPKVLSVFAKKELIYEDACASKMSFLCTDTKGDLFRNYAGIAKDCYGYNVSVLDLRNPTRSNGNNLLHLVNKYMDIYKNDHKNLAAKAKAEKYAKILSKTLINSNDTNYGQNQFFYDSAEGLLTSVFLLLAEYLSDEDEDHRPCYKRHIVSVFKLVQELLAPSDRDDGTNQFQDLIERLPENHKARWFAGAALNSSTQAMASILSTVLSRLNTFLDSEMEQLLCFDTAIDAEKFCNEKSAIFIVLPEEDNTKYAIVSLLLQNLYREILAVADEQGGQLRNRVVFYCDELGTIPPIQSLELMFSASRSRRLMLVPIVQSITGQLQKNYGKEGSEIIVDNCQLNIFGGFAPASQTAEEMSKALGNRTVLSGSISRGKDKSQSLQMMERPLMSADELKAMPKGEFIVMKTGMHPMKVKLKLFLDWGITFGKPYEVPERAERSVHYASKQELVMAIQDQSRNNQRPHSGGIKLSSEVI